MALIVSFIFLFICISISVSPVILAQEEIHNLDKAEVLKALGSFLGTENGFELGRQPTRLEGAVMLVRLLGKEKFALSQKLPHPFLDVPAWGIPYVSYMYQAGLTNGVSAKAYGSSDYMSPVQYAAFVLRALGYDDSRNDFIYVRSLEKLVEIGLLDEKEANELMNDNKFLRDDVVLISYKALTACLKDSPIKLIAKLVEDDKAVNENAAISSGLYTPVQDGAQVQVTDYGYRVENRVQLLELLEKSISGLQPEIKFDLRYYTDNSYTDIVNIFNEAETGTSLEASVDHIAGGWTYAYNSEQMVLKVAYYYTQDKLEIIKNRLELTDNKARRIVKSIVNDNMTDYEKELVFHDYIINNTVYDYENYIKGTVPEESHTTFGALVLGKAVCDGYASTMSLLCGLSGIECMNVIGKASSSSGLLEDHAWNIIKIDGEYYQVDVTFDDPASQNSQQTLLHHYFNLTDEKISKDHAWVLADFPQCVSTTYNYYYNNNMTAKNRDEFQNRLQDVILKKQKEIELLLEDFNVQVYKDIQDIISKSHAVRSYFWSVNETLGIIRVYDLKYY